MVLPQRRANRYPLNANTALIVNVPLAYTFYALPIVRPNERWVTLASVLFGRGYEVMSRVRKVRSETAVTAAP